MEGTIWNVSLSDGRRTYVCDLSYSSMRFIGELVCELLLLLSRLEWGLRARLDPSEETDVTSVSTAMLESLASSSLSRRDVEVSSWSY